MLARPAQKSIEELKEIAWEAIEYTHQKLPLGSVNKKSDEDHPYYEQATQALVKARANKDFLFYQMKMVLGARAQLDPESDVFRLFCYAKVFEKFQAGNCQEQAVVAFEYIRKRYNIDIDYCNMQGGDHYFLVLDGRVVCDPWVDEVYHVSRFAEKREESKQLVYAQIVYKARPHVKHYLFGTPQTLLTTNGDNQPAIKGGMFVNDAKRALEGVCDDTPKEPLFKKAC